MANQLQSVIKKSTDSDCGKKLIDAQGKQYSVNMAVTAIKMSAPFRVLILENANSTQNGGLLD